MRCRTKPAVNGLQGQLVIIEGLLRLAEGLQIPIWISSPGTLRRKGGGEYSDSLCGICSTTLGSALDASPAPNIAGKLDRTSLLRWASGLVLRSATASLYMEFQL